MSTSSVWHALAVESGTAASQLTIGATLLEKTSPDSPESLYATFFPLSIGMERLGKIILQVDSKVSSGSFLPRKKMSNDLRHNLSKLLAKVEEVGNRRYSTPQCQRPADPIHRSIVNILSGFSEGGRYYHLDQLAGIGAASNAAADWCAQVVDAILAQRHGTDQRRESKLRSLGADISSFTQMRRTLADGTEIRDPGELFVLGDQYRTSLPLARMYTLQIVRWMARVLSNFDFLGHGDPDIPFFCDFFRWITGLSDKDLRRRKRYEII